MLYWEDSPEVPISIRAPIADSNSSSSRNKSNKVGIRGSKSRIVMPKAIQLAKHFNAYWSLITTVLMLRSLMCFQYTINHDY